MKAEAHHYQSLEELCTLFVSSLLLIDPGRAQKVTEVAASFLSRRLSGLLSMRVAASSGRFIAPHRHLDRRAE
jgi:hypothetical protein